MDKEIFVQNVKKYCEAKGVKPTVACRESGVGTSFINNIEKRNQTPSVEKVQLLADYLGVTTSELLGEEKPTPATGDGLSVEQLEVVRLFQSASPALRAAALAVLKSAEGQGKAPGVYSEDE